MEKVREAGGGLVMEGFISDEMEFELDVFWDMKGQAEVSCVFQMEKDSFGDEIQTQVTPGGGTQPCTEEVFIQSMPVCHGFTYLFLQRKHC